MNSWSVVIFMGFYKILFVWKMIRRKVEKLIQFGKSGLVWRLGSDGVNGQNSNLNKILNRIKIILNKIKNNFFLIINSIKTKAFLITNWLGNGKNQIWRVFLMHVILRMCVFIIFKILLVASLAYFGVNVDNILWGYYVYIYRWIYKILFGK